MRLRFTGSSQTVCQMPGRPGVEDALRLFLPVLFAPRDGHVPAGVFGPDHNDVLPGFAGERGRYVGGERRVPAFVRGYLYAVDPDGSAAIHGAEVEEQSIVLVRTRYSNVRAYQTTSWKAVLPMPESRDW